MNGKDNPPWNIETISTNEIDMNNLYIPSGNIFDMQIDTKSNQHESMQEATTIIQNSININQTQLAQKDNTIKQNSTESITLALKYRPKTFSELIGQSSVAKTLCLALDSKKIANAYLFSGLRGSGKTSSARILARCLQCEKDITSSPCGICINCKAALNNSHMDIIELDGASNRKIDDIRDIIEQTKYKPTMGRFKVFIIDEVHMLTKEAFNSLLKTLEEPPNYVKFILATTDPLKVPPTILSRTQHFRFKKIPTNSLKNHLIHILQEEGVSADSDSLDMIIRNGHGSVRDTLTLLDQAIVFCQNELTTQKLADMLGSLDPRAFDELFQALLRKNMQDCLKFVKSLDGYEIEMILDELSLYIKNKMLEEIPQIPPILGMRYANIINDSKAMLQLDCDSDFCLLLTILKMLEAQKIREVENAIKQLEETKLNNLINTSNIPQTQLQDNVTANNADSNVAGTNNSNANNQQDNQNNMESNIDKDEHTKDTHINDKEHVVVNNTKTLSYVLTQNNEMYLLLIQKLYDRDYNIGNLFENKIAFNKIEDNILYLTFYMNQEEIDLLKSGYKGIMQVVREVFGMQTKMQVEKKPPKDLELLMQTTYDNHDTKEDLSNNTHKDSAKEPNNEAVDMAIEQYQPNNIESNVKIEPMDFIEQNKEILRNMQDKLGVKDVKIIPLDL